MASFLCHVFEVAKLVRLERIVRAVSSSSPGGDAYALWQGFEFHPRWRGNKSVSYTHLDVYKRQGKHSPSLATLRKYADACGKQLVLRVA